MCQAECKTVLAEECRLRGNDEMKRIPSACSVPVTRSPARHTAARLQLGLHRKRGRMQDADPDQLGWAGVEAAVHSMLGRKQRCIRLLGCMDGWDGWMDAQTRRERRPRPGCEEAAGGEARSGRPGGHGHGQAGQAKKQKEAKGRSPRPPAPALWPSSLSPPPLPLWPGWLAGWLALLDSALVRSLSLARCVGCVAWAPVATEHPFLTTIPHPHTPAPSSSPSYSPPPVSSPSHLFPPFSSLSLTKHIPLAGQVFSIPLDPRL